MFIPFLSTSSTTPSSRRKLFRRKGGGGGGRGGSGGGSRGGSSSSTGSNKGGSRGSSSGSSSSGGKSSFPISSSGKSFSVSASSSGGIPKSSISSGGFAGREVGGGTRGQVYGSSVYGSGYPDIASRGVSNRGFPFVFYPVVYPQNSGPDYLYREQEYGKIDNTTRPGGPLTQISIVESNYTLRITSDQMTINALSSDLSSCATSSTGVKITSPAPVNSSSYDHPKPEEALQYYRASSVVLSLDSFNNSIAFSSNDSSMMYALIPAGINTTIVQCTNQTIGANVLLPNGSMINVSMPHSLVMFFFWFAALYHILL
ncbi:hypothetical protein BDQ17DRAFT_1364230 [Cyathus striatus]|nr:hypothetical protein BDQ17DRAFT_1364230 [Cyathus striatus]